MSVIKTLLVEIKIKKDCVAYLCIQGGCVVGYYFKFVLYSSCMYLFILYALLVKPLFLDTFHFWCAVRSENYTAFPGVESV